MSTSGRVNIHIKDFFIDMAYVDSLGSHGLVKLDLDKSESVDIFDSG